MDVYKVLLEYSIQLEVRIGELGELLENSVKKRRKIYDDAVKPLNLMLRNYRKELGYKLNSFDKVTNADEVTLTENQQIALDRYEHQLEILTKEQDNAYSYEKKMGKSIEELKVKLENHKEFIVHVFSLNVD